jgi:hypothetical protein
MATVRGHRYLGLLVCVTLVGVFAAPSSAGAARRAPALRLLAPAVTTEGGLTRVEVVVDGAPSLGAFQANLRFDERAVEVARVQAPATFAGSGTVTTLSDVETPNRKILAAYSCGSRACATSAASMPDGSTVMTIDVTPWHTGRIELRLDGGLLVDRTGGVIARTAPSTIWIDVDGNRPVWRAPHGVAPAANARRHRDSLDVTRDGRVTTTDVVAMQRSFITGADDDVACPHPELGTDADGDGCITIADLQTVAAAASAAPRATAATAASSVTFVVNSTSDAPDATTDGVCQTATPGECTFRAALQEADAAASAAVIDFHIPGGGIETIKPATPFPSLVNPNGITIDGTTQPGSTVNTDPIADNAKYRIELEGLGIKQIDGLYISTDNNTIRGLDMDKWRRAIWIVGGNSNTIVGNMIGLTPGGALINNLKLSRPANCVVIQGGSQNNVVGAAGAANRNVISGCAHNGVSLYDYPTKNNLIQNNIVGLDPTGTQARGSVAHGIDLNTGTQYTTVGGSDPSLRNVSSGNQQEGVEISHNPLTQHDSVIGNFIGTDLTGDNAPAYAMNHTVGLRLEGNPDCQNKPCPSDEGFMTVTDNVIVNSGGGGVMIDKGVHDSTFARNNVGVTANGTPAGNHVYGVRLEAGATRITIGPANEIANNSTGIMLTAIGTSPPNSAETATNQNTFTQNSIYSNDLNGTEALGIDLAPFGSVNTASNSDSNVNDAMLAPTLSNATSTTVDATTCASCVVEVFLADRAAGMFGSGQTYLVNATANSSGVAHISLPAAAHGHVVTATATNTRGSTSEFGKNVAIP